MVYANVSSPPVCTVQLATLSRAQEHASFVAPGAPPLPRAIRTCPATLGVRCSGRKLEGEDVDGADDHTTVVIAKGSLLPAQSTTTVKLVPASPESTFVVEVVEIGVGQAEDGKEGRVPVARLLGTLGFEGVVGDDQGKGVLEVKVGCTLRSEGVLKVEAVATESGAKRELLIGHEGNS